MVRLGSLYGSKGQLEKAEASLRKAASLDPKSFLALTNLANVLIMQKEYEDAVEIFMQAHKIKKTAQSCMSMGVALEALGKTKQACGAYDNAIALGHKDPKLRNHVNKLRR